LCSVSTLSSCSAQYGLAYSCKEGACVNKTTQTNTTINESVTNDSISSSGGGGGGGGSSGIRKNTPNSPKKISISSEDKSKIISENNEVSSQIPISESEEKVYATHSNGEQVEIKITPEEAIQSTNNLVGENTIEGVNVIESEEKVLYEIESVKEGKFLFIFNVDAKILTYVDVENGEVISIDKPWWSFLARLK